MVKRNLVAVGILGSVLMASAPVFAEGHGGGGHAGGGHFGGGGHAAAGHAAGGGAHFAPGAHFAGGARAYGGAHAYGGSFHGSTYAGHPGYGGYRGGYGGYHGYSTGAFWGGGYWHGGFWPRAYYGLGYAWFLPVLPLAYATYWYGGTPYYYANDVYYTWNPGYQGYTATDPPPVADPNGAGAAVPPPAPGAGDPNAGAPTSAPEGDPNAGAAYAPAPNNGPLPAPDPSPYGQQTQIFMYPKNGQSAEQQSADKRECQQWASQQAGQGAANGGDYRRAMVACVEGRGYSAN